MKYSWEAKVHEFEAAGKTEESLDVIFDTLDELLLSGDFDECSAILGNLSVKDFTNAQLVTILTATCPASEKLPMRKEFFQRAFDELLERQQNTKEDVWELVSGLESSCIMGHAKKSNSDRISPETTSPTVRNKNLD